MGVGALLDVSFQVVREQDKWKGSVVEPKGLATRSGQRRESGAVVRGAVVRIHGGGQRGAVLSRVGEWFGKECDCARRVAFVLQC